MNRQERLALLRLASASAQSVKSGPPESRRRKPTKSEMKVSFVEPSPSEIRRAPTPPPLGKTDLGRALRVAAERTAPTVSSRSEPSGIEPDPYFEFLNSSYSVGGLRKLQFRTGEAETEDGKWRTVISPGADSVLREAFREAGIAPRFREVWINGLTDRITKPRVVPRQRRKSKSGGRKGATVYR